MIEPAVPDPIMSGPDHRVRSGGVDPHNGFELFCRRFHRVRRGAEYYGRMKNGIDAAVLLRGFLDDGRALLFGCDVEREERRQSPVFLVAAVVR